MEKYVKMEGDIRRIIMYKKTIGMRLLAYLIDGIFIFLLGLLLHYLIDFGTVTQENGVFNFNMNWWETTVVAGIYFMLFAFLNKGKTIGKLATKVEIRNTNLDQTPLKQIVIREALKSVLIVISIISFFFVVFRSDRKSIHDLVVDTIVIRPAKNEVFIEAKPEEPKKDNIIDQL